MPKIAKSLKDLFIYLLSGGLTRLFPLILLPYIAGTLSETDFGIFTLYRLYTALGAVIILFGVEQGLFRYIPGKPDTDKNRYTGSALYFLLVSGIIVLIIFIFSGDAIQALLFERDLRFSPLLIPLMLITTALSSLIATRHSAEKNSTAFMAVNLIRHGLFFILFAAGLALGYGLTFFFASYFLAELTVYLFSSKMLFNALRTGLRRSLLKELLHTGLPLMGVLLTAQLLYQSDHYLIKYFIGIEQTGIYNYAYRFAAVLSVFVILTNNVWMPRLFEKGEKMLVQYLKDYSTLIALSLNAILLLVIALFTFKNDWLIPAGFEEALIILAVSGFGYLFYAHAQFLDGWLVLIKKSGLIFIFSLIGLIINIVLNIIFIPRYGMIAAAAVTAFSFVIIWLALIVYLITKKRDYGFAGLISEFFLTLLPMMLYFISAEILLSCLLFLAIAAVLLIKNQLLRALLGYEQR